MLLQKTCIAGLTMLRRSFILAFSYGLSYGNNLPGVRLIYPRYPTPDHTPFCAQGSSSAADSPAEGPAGAASTAPSPLPAGDTVAALGAAWAAAEPTTERTHGSQVAEAIAAALLPGALPRPTDETMSNKHHLRITVQIYVSRDI